MGMLQGQHGGVAQAGRGLPGRGAHLRDDDPVGERRGLRARPQGGRARSPLSSRMMNAKARELGMLHSTFRTPHGFPPPSRRIADGDLTTPARLLRSSAGTCSSTPTSSSTPRSRPRTFGAGVRLQPVQMTNHNHLLGKIPGRRRPEDRLHERRGLLPGRDGAARRPQGHRRHDGQPRPDAPAT